MNPKKKRRLIFYEYLIKKNYNQKSAVIKDIILKPEFNYFLVELVIITVYLNSKIIKVIINILLSPGLHMPEMLWWIMH